MIQIFLIIADNHTRTTPPNGALFIGKPQAYFERKHFFGEKSLAYIMNQVDSVDIDTELDLIVAAAILSTSSIYVKNE